MTRRPQPRSRVVAIAAIALAASLATAAPASAVAGFGDVAVGRFYTDAVQWLVDNEITTGTSPTCFSPDATVTRGQGAAFIWRMEGAPTPATDHPFTDVSQDWQQDPVSWMVENEVTTGTSPTTFSPERFLTRGELAVLVWRLEGEPVGAPPHPFGDVTKDWQQAAVSWMYDTGLTTGTTPSTFSPDDSLTRGQAATFLYRLGGSPPLAVDYSHPADGSCATPVAPPAVTPILTAVDTIRTRPFAGSTTSLFDGEGMAYVPADDTLWVADDNATDTVLHELDIATGELLDSISVDDLAAAPRFGGGPTAGAARAGDLESLAYDPANDHLYAFSGTTDGAPTPPTAFRLTRQNGSFAVESYQPLLDGADSAAALPDGSLYIVQNDVTTPDDIHTYDYETNTVGPGFSIAGVPGSLWGIGFSPDGADLYIGNDVTTLYRVDWATRTIDPGYRFSVESSLDEPTAIELIAGDLYLLDGDDSRTGSLKYAVHVFSITTNS